MSDWTDGEIGAALTFIFGLGGGAVTYLQGVQFIGLLMMAFSFWGLVFVAARHWSPRVRREAVSFMGWLSIAGVLTVLVGWHFTPTAAPASAPPRSTEPRIAEKVDPHAFCFIGFDGYHNDQSMAVTAELHNQNKEAVEFTLMAANFSLDGYPVPPQIEAKHETLFPEEHLVKEDSAIVWLGRDFAGGTQLHGQVDFQARYGPDAANTALLRVRGKVTITLGPTGTRTADLKWEPAPESLPDCSQEILAAYDKLRT